MMAARWRYRVTSVAGTAVLAAVAVWIANLTAVQEAIHTAAAASTAVPATLVTRYRHLAAIIDQA